MLLIRTLSNKYLGRLPSRVGVRVAGWTISVFQDDKHHNVFHIKNHSIYAGWTSNDGGFFISRNSFSSVHHSPVRLIHAADLATSMSRHAANFSSMIQESPSQRAKRPKEDAEIGNSLPCASQNSHQATPFHHRQNPDPEGYQIGLAPILKIHPPKPPSSDGSTPAACQTLSLVQHHWRFGGRYPARYGHLNCFSASAVRGCDPLLLVLMRVECARKNLGKLRCLRGGGDAPIWGSSPQTGCGVFRADTRRRCLTCRSIVSVSQGWHGRCKTAGVTWLILVRKPLRPDAFSPAEDSTASVALLLLRWMGSWDTTPESRDPVHAARMSRTLAYIYAHVAPRVRRRSRVLSF